MIISGDGSVVMGEEVSEGRRGHVEGEWRLKGEEECREFAMREWGSNGRWGKITIDGGEWDLRSGRGWGEGMTSLGGSSSGRRRRRGREICTGCSDVGLVRWLIGLGGVLNSFVIVAGEEHYLLLQKQRYYVLNLSSFADS